MAKAGIFFAEGYEEIEALTVVDLCRRAGVEIQMISVTGEGSVAGSHGICVKMDALLTEVDFGQLDMLILPGGMPGTAHLAAHKELGEALVKAVSEERRVAAICAAPSVLGGLGLLKGKKATCYPGFEDKLTGAEYTSQGVITDGLVTTARGLGYALDLGLELLGLLDSRENAAKIKASIQYDQV